MLEKSVGGYGHKIRGQIVQRIVKILICADYLNHLPFPCTAVELFLSLFVCVKIRVTLPDSTVLVIFYFLLSTGMD